MTEETTFHTDGRKKDRFHFGKFTAHILIAFGTSVTLGSVLVTFFARKHWICDLFSHFLVQYYVILWIAAIFYLVQKKLKFAFLILCFCGYLSWKILPEYYWPKKDISFPTTTPIRLMSYNLHSINREYEIVLEYIRKSNSDIMVLLEITPEWEKKLTPLYPYFYAISRRDSFGIMILSKIPFVDVRKRDFGRFGIPSIVAKFQQEGKNFTVIGTHPPPPITRSSSIERNLIFSAISESILNHTEPCLICGDFNCTPFSPYLQDFLRSSSLQDARKGFGIDFTWPNIVQFPKASYIFGIMIDHCFVSGNIVVQEYQSAKSGYGSDHIPIEVLFAFQK